MHYLRLAIFFLLPVLICRADAWQDFRNWRHSLPHHNLQPNPKTPPPRGQPIGDYVVTVAGHFAGDGSAAVTTTASLSAYITDPKGNAGTFTFSALPITKDHFIGSGTIMGLSCTIDGRVDVPADTDPEATDKQSITGRITGVFKDTNGNVGRFVAIQQNPHPVNPP